MKLSAAVLCLALSMTAHVSHAAKPAEVGKPADTGKPADAGQGSKGGSLTAAESCDPEDLLGKGRCCESEYNGGSSFGSCETASCEPNFGKKNLNCFNYGSSQNPLITDEEKAKSKKGGSNNCPYMQADRAICDVSKYIDDKNCRDSSSDNHCLGEVKCMTNGVTIEKGGGKPHSDGTASGGGACQFNDKRYPAGTLCFYNGASENFKVCADADDANGGGDPHFQTFDGTQYSYHGECDLVMTRSRTFADNLGLDLHIRTKGMGGWSLISNAALRIGDDILEFENDGTHYINGSPLALPYDMARRYTVTKERTITEKEDEEGNIRTIDKTVATVDLGNNKEIRFTRLGKGIMFVKVKGFFIDAEGMLGIHGLEGMVGRDRQSVLSDPNEMGAQWQVNDSEPMLFRESRAPQFPQACILPDVDASQRRLRMSEAQMNAAEKACRPVSDEVRELCIHDVLLSGDIHSADGYLFGEAF